MRRRGNFGLSGLTLILLILGLSGCASVGGGAGGVPAAVESAENGWWYASFRMNWPPDSEPAGYMDLLIAREVVAPVLDRHSKDIVLWRFHRRAARDEAGHRFSFIFYTTAAKARRIYEDIDSNAVLGRIRADGAVTRVIYDDTSTVPRPGIDATSDRNWSPPLCRAWPYFIMGVSQTWLDLIEQYADDGRKKPSSPEELPAFYQKLNDEVEATWKKEGGHAFLHHLNAIFGYGPVNLRGKTEMSF